MENLIDEYLNTHRVYIEEVRRDMLGIGVRLLRLELRKLEQTGRLKYGRTFQETLDRRLHEVNN